MLPGGQYAAGWVLSPYHGLDGFEPLEPLELLEPFEPLEPLSCHKTKTSIDELMHNLLV